ncbi:MAG: iron ABC transporter permease, partial [Pseudomonadota bacterium]
MDRQVIRAMALLLAAICLMPLLGVVLAASLGSLDTLRQLADTVLWQYIWTTLALSSIVALGSIVIGAGTAWLVVTTDFPGRRIFEIVLVVPLAFPAYVLAYAYTDVLDHPGIVQTTLRYVTGWGPRDYWFP